MTIENKLPLSDFKQVVKNAPLFAIDLVVVNESRQLLVGKRINSPAKGYWFVPGGRVYKNESLERAVNRIAESELGCAIDRKQLTFLGLFDHFYHDSFFDGEVSTHYINAAHLVFLNEKSINLPTEQHDSYRWIDIDKLDCDCDVHNYSKVFLPELIKYIQP
ncbi:GDP-mannose mannosyl hydrolase [Thiomicrorhabdus sp.]|uniref:GDP-mannose mannosyl hydrolase n=1 Tax=Thiomicrorhabdus sp. TaxID=2039724 RepID=UPI0029C75303|nr:GDP-mannose mannosyl hydrolase [Thiomicrorhabdus sp.]